MKCKIRQKTFICGDYRHVMIYPVFSSAKGSIRKKKYKPTSENQQKINEKRATLWLQMIMETNFDDKDFFFTVTYKPGQHPATDTQAMKDAKNFIRRVQYHCQKKGLPEPVAVWCTERGKGTRRYHHHYVIKSELSDDELTAIWGKGRTKPLKLRFDEDGLKGLANYLPKEPIGERRYHSTRNIKKPEERQNDQISQKQYKEIFENVHFKNARELEKIFKGYFVSGGCMEDYDNFFGQYAYIKLYKQDSKYIR